jgi:hypothetical protein
VVVIDQSSLGIVAGIFLEFAVFESVSTCDCNAYFVVVLTTRDVITCPPISYYRTERRGCHSSIIV